MAVRLWEMRRALNDGGPAAGDPAGVEGDRIDLCALRFDGWSLVEDVDGQHLRDGNFRKDIVRKHSHGHSSAKRYAAVRSMTRFGSIPNLTGTLGPMLACRTTRLTSRDASSLTTTTDAVATGPTTSPVRARETGRPARNGEGSTRPRGAGAGCICPRCRTRRTPTAGSIGARAAQHGQN